MRFPDETAFVADFPMASVEPVHPDATPKRTPQATWHACCST